MNNKDTVAVALFLLLLWWLKPKTETSVDIQYNPWDFIPTTPPVPVESEIPRELPY